MKKINNLSDKSFLTYSLGKQVKAFSTKRLGGVSLGNYDSLNLDINNGDSLKCVSENRHLLCQSLNIDESQLIMPKQTHGNMVACITKHFFYLSLLEKSLFLEGVDALITNEPGICIGVATADCVPILFYDSFKKVVAVAHAGWRGTVNKIVNKVVFEMQKEYGTCVTDLKVIIGPSISQKAFEVGDEVYTAFKEAEFDMSTIAMRSGLKWHLDLWLANQRLLINNGIMKNQIEFSSVCTYYNFHEFFSARRLGIHSGRIFTGMMLLQEEDID